MRKPVFAVALALGPLLAAAQQVSVPSPSPAAAQDKTQPSPRLNSATTDRAENLSTHMVRDLHLNSFLADRTRQINLDYTTKLAAIEREQARNPAEASRQTTALNQTRDQQFQALLSSDQYTDYFDARKRYAQLDHDYAHNASASLLNEAIQHPAPVRPNEAVMGQGKAGAKPGRAAVRQ
ncbi:hypothetical protein HHL22_06870 [Hymenobacter sp. RP-2-7]|uniref:DUF4142 domain-containing protein n=1 Tax=Hymenobacter polaris TaxID=2682546 RepID=A0A7Y0AD74_9BACT|nr:hypothetical protein [Hymenobacter polaris]NML64925.1 hypothetical protein [Hymenobacter polaris]